MRTGLTLIAAVGALCLTASGAQAVDKGTARISWTGCDPIVSNLDFTGVGQLANLIMSVTNASELHRGYRFQIRIGPNTPNAWHHSEQIRPFADACRQKRRSAQRPESKGREWVSQRLPAWTLASPSV